MNTDNNEMDLLSLVEKYDMQEGDEVLCTAANHHLHGEGVFKINEKRSCERASITGDYYCGDGGQLFKLPEGSPYLKETEETPEHEFVRSCQPNTKENQEALFELGYRWLLGTEVCHLGDGLLLYTNINGWLTVGDVSGNGYEPKRYSFKTVATLLPKEPIESKTQREIRLATEELEAVTKRLKALKLASSEEG